MIKLEIKTENAAFEGDNFNHEVWRILEDLTNRIETNGVPDHMLLRDYNGNVVGEIKII